MIIQCPTLQATASHTLLRGDVHAQTGAVTPGMFASIGFDIRAFRSRVMPDLNEVGDIVYWGHVPLEDRAVLARYRTLPAVIPLRHPKVIAHTWQLKRAEAQQKNWPLGNSVDVFVEEFTFLATEYPLGPGVHYIPFDLPKPQRDGFITQINADLGINLPLNFNVNKDVHGNSGMTQDTVPAHSEPAKIDALLAQPAVATLLSALYG